MATRSGRPSVGAAPAKGFAQVSSVNHAAKANIAVSASGAVRGFRIAAANPSSGTAPITGTARGVIPVVVTDTIAATVVTGADAGLPATWTPAFVIPAGARTPLTHTAASRLLVADTITGRIHFELPHTALSWNSPLKKIGQVAATLPIDDSLQAIFEQGAANPRSALREILTGPYRFSLVVARAANALFGGPLLPMTGDEENSAIAIQGAGLERMFEKRVLAKQGGTAALADASRDVSAAMTNVRAAMRAVVAEATATYVTGQNRGLPITLPTVDGSGTEDFLWKSYDTVKAWKALTDLASRTDGPDLRFEPHLYETDNGAFVYWGLELGTPTFPLSNGVPGPNGPRPWTWDDDMCTVTPTTDSTNMATTYFSSGAGQDRAKAVASATSTRLTALGFPPLEETDTANASEATQAVVQGRASALVAANDLPRRSWTLKVPVNGLPALGQYRRGDAARIEIRNKTLIEHGDYVRRITNIAHDGGPTATVTCDYEDQLEGAL